MTENEARSTLYALLEAVRALDINRGDIDGTLHFAIQGEAPSFVIFDAVPGGAGNAHRIAERLPALFEAAYQRVEKCECGEETSCYNCLRNYRNQLWHDRISRRDALHVLRRVTGARGAVAGRIFDPHLASELALLHEEARPLVERIVRLGAPMPIVGFEVRGDDADLPWSVEAAWEEKKVAVLVDSNPDRDQRLAREGWDVRPVSEWTEESLFFKVV
ncbi:MAG: DUF1998 domain-containing protein [Gemmatimonadetes bacterium]|nr:DUF1998 domain-containing protein [Gemmatimonadota bacterium]